MSNALVKLGSLAENTGTKSSLISVQYKNVDDVKKRVEVALILYFQGKDVVRGRHGTGAAWVGLGYKLVNNDTLL